MQDENTLTPDNSQENEELYPVEPKNQDQPSKSQFFTFNTILSLILLVGLIVLYILFFTAKRSPEPQAHLALQKSGSGSISVAFVNIDSLNREVYRWIHDILCAIFPVQLKGAIHCIQFKIFQDHTAVFNFNGAYHIVIGKLIIIEFIDPGDQSEINVTGDFYHRKGQGIRFFRFSFR